MQDDQAVLVVIVNNRADWRRVIEQGWYRIPVKHAPTPLAASYLAFYFTKVFAPHAWQIRFYAPVQRYRIATRLELLPEQLDHPRARERYYKIELGPVAELPRPVPSRSLRRVVFDPTTWERLHSVHDVAELWLADDPTQMIEAEFPDVLRKTSARLMLEE